MIADIILKSMAWVMGVVFSWLPTAPELPSEIWSSWEFMEPALIKANTIVPVTTMFQILGLILVFEISVVLFKVGIFTIKLIRG